jgi:hypothetical protein
VADAGGVIPTQEPPLVPVAPRLGWGLADRGRRVAAVLALPLGALVSALAVTGNDTRGVPEWLLWGWIAVGPMTFYSLARVLRPELRSPERTPRHLLAAAGAAFSVPMAATIALGGDDELGVAIVFGVPAFALGALTLAWGLIAFAVRAAPRWEPRRR